MQTIEYRVIPVTRYFVTRFERDETGQSSSCVTKGEYESEGLAYEVGNALCKVEHDSLGWPDGDERISYPRTDTIQKAAAEQSLSG